MAATIPYGFRALPLSIAQLSLASVLKCGQSFRWTALPLTTDPNVDATGHNFEYRYTLKDRVVCLRQTPETLFYRAVFPEASSGTSRNAFDLEKTREAETLAWLKDYFQLEVDLEKLYDIWGELDPVFGHFRNRFTGIRMLRQDPWENLVSFICSQNNHISRITNMVQSLCIHFSPALVSMPHPAAPSLNADHQGLLTYHSFPSPALLASPETSTILRSLGFGYRAEYLQRTAHMLVETHGEHGAEEFVRSLRQKPTDEARNELLKFVGVGRKVADCVLLMSLDKRQVVPVDTHVHQIAVKHYGMRGASTGTKATMTPKLYDEVQTRLTGLWGEYAGWAHSVLFTADLKSFSTHGLPTPSPSVSPEKHRGKGKLKDVQVTPDPNSSPTRPAKRKRFTVKSEMVVEETSRLSQGNEKGSLADRVKRRRRLNLVRGYVESA